MLGAQLMIGADYGALKERPDALYGVRMNDCPYPFLLSMVDRLMAGIPVGDAFISRPPLLASDSTGAD